MQPLTIALFLLACAAVLMLVELVVPSGGVISLLAALCVCGAIISAFFAGSKTGISFLIGTSVAVAVGAFLFFKIWPHTPMGRRIVMAPQSEEEVIDESRRDSVNRLIGESGIAKTQMLPSGLVIVGEETYDAVSEGMAIEPGEPVEVVAVRMNRLIVRPVEESGSESDAAVAQSEKGSVDDILSRPIDSLGIDPIDDPLA